MNIEIKDHTKEWLSEFDKSLARALNSAGQQCENYAIENITAQKAVDTGRLRSSITHEVDLNDKSVTIGTNVHYAPYVELGTGKYNGGGRQEPWVYQDEKGQWHRTSGMKARPYLKPALEDHRQEYINIIRSEMEG